MSNAQSSSLPCQRLSLPGSRGRRGKDCCSSCPLQSPGPERWEQAYRGRGLSLSSADASWAPPCLPCLSVTAPLPAGGPPVPSLPRGAPVTPKERLELFPASEQGPELFPPLKNASRPAFLKTGFFLQLFISGLLPQRHFHYSPTDNLFFQSSQQN